MATGRLKAGVAELDITPKVGVQLAGEVNSRAAKGVRTPLMAKALVLANGEEMLALVTLDLFGLESAAAGKLTAAIAQQCGLRPEAVMVVSSHTRGGPYTTPVVGWPGVDEAYLADIVARVPAVAVEAGKKLADASLGLGHVVLPHLVYNHRLMTRNMKAITAWVGVPKNEVMAPEGPTDPEFGVLVVRDGKGFPLCLLWNMAADNRFARDDQISADLPGLVQAEVDQRVGRHLPSLYLAGCGGNVSYVGGLDEAVDAVASAVMAVQLDTPCDPLIKLGCAMEKVILPIRDYSRFWSEWDIQQKWPQAAPAFAQEVELMQKEAALAVPTSLRAWRLGQFGLVGLPGVPFVEFALEIKGQSPFRGTVVAGNVGDHVGIVTTRRAFDGEGFEAWPARSAKVGPGGGEFLAEEASSLLQRLART